MTTIDVKANAHLSKLRYKEIDTRLEDKELDRSTIDICLQIIRDVLQFDPNHNGYLDVKPKLIEQGSTYNKHKKSYYERHKEEINKKALDRYYKKKGQQQASLVAAT